jgi:hypothetical protein
MRTHRTLLALATIVGFASTAAAQAKSTGTGFGLGYTDIGPAVGVGGVNGASASFGGRFEHALKALPDMGNGTLGIQASFDYYSWGSDVGAYSWSYRYIPIGVTGNYHFKMQDTKLDPFVGLGLGYNLVSCSYDGPGVSSTCGYSSGIYPIARVGGRYFFSPKMAGYADVGAGAALLNVGVMFKMK